MGFIWSWLRNAEKRKLLSFIFGGIAGVITALYQFGLIGGKNAPASAIAPVTAPVAAPASIPAQARAHQSAEAGPHGTALNIIGNGNSINIPTRR